MLALVILIVLTTLTIWSLTTTVTPNAIKDLINNQLHLISTQKSYIDGNISWQLFPQPGIKITQVHMNENNNKYYYSLYVENLFLNLQLSSLLHGALIFNELKINGFKINIHFKAQPKTHQHKEPETIVISSTPPSKISAQFPLDRILLTHGQLIVSQAQNKMVLTGLQVGAKQLNVKNKFFPLQLKSTFSISVAKNNTKGTCNYKGKIRLASAALTQPIAALQHAAVDGQLLAQNVRVNKFKITTINANVKTKQDEIILNPFNIALYAGKSVGDLNYQFISKKLSINQTAASLDANRLFNDLMTNHLIKGTLDFSVHTTISLQNSDWQDNLRASGNLIIRDGILYFIDLNKLIDEIKNKIHSLLTQTKSDINHASQTPLFNSTTHPQGNTKFQLLSIQYHALDNKLMNDSILLQTDKLQLKGRGYINLNDATQDFDLSAKLIADDSQVDTIQQLLGGSFPLKVVGTLTKPQVLPNANKLNPIISAYLLRYTIEKPVKQVADQLKNILTDSKDLFDDNDRSVH